MWCRMLEQEWGRLFLETLRHDQIAPSRLHTLLTHKKRIRFPPLPILSYRDTARYVVAHLSAVRY